MWSLPMYPKNASLTGLGRSDWLGDRRPRLWEQLWWKDQTSCVVWGKNTSTNTANSRRRVRTCCPVALASWHRSVFMWTVETCSLQSYLSLTSEKNWECGNLWMLPIRLCSDSSVRCPICRICLDKYIKGEQQRHSLLFTAETFLYLFFKPARGKL